MKDIREKYSPIYGASFLTGIFMWVNAIKDIALFIDWPDCVFYKADLIYKTHDLFSDIKQASTDTRLYFSWVMPNKMVRGYDDEIKRKLWFIVDNKKFNLGIVTSMPVTNLLAQQYESIYSEFEKDFLFIPSKMDKFWLDWYALLLQKIAMYFEFNKKQKMKKLSISIVWYLFDRNEGDCLWNIKEIKRMLSLLWVEIDSIWLSGWNLKDLSKIENSDLIVSFPYWLSASKILSKKLGIEVLDLEVPFWIKNSMEFIKKIWVKLWIDNEKIDKIIKQENFFIKEKIDLIEEKIFVNKNFLYAWDLFLESGIKDIWNFLWMNHIFTYNYNWVRKCRKWEYGNIDLIIWNSGVLEKDSEFYFNSKYKLEFWFPSYNTHFLLERPYMWFKWFLFFIERLYYEFTSLK